jgi:hypothetical protein
MARLINIDNGGTLTDFCLVEDGEVQPRPTSPPAAGALWLAPTSGTVPNRIQSGVVAEVVGAVTRVR